MGWGGVKCPTTYYDSVSAACRQCLSPVCVHCTSLPCGSTAVVPVSFPPPFCPLAAEAPPLPLPSIAARQVVLESIVLLTNSPRMTAAAAATTTANVLPMDPAQMKNLLVVGKK